MNRYFTSFLLVLTIYIACAFGAFYVFKDDLKLVHKEIEKTEKISLNEINFTKPKELVETVKKEQKKVIKKSKHSKEKLIHKKVIDKVVKNNIDKQVKKSLKKVDKKKSNTNKIVEQKNKIKNEYKISKTPQKNESLIKDDKNVKKDYKDRNLALIISLIKQNIVYPSIARKRNIQGVVEVKFSVLRNGEVENIVILSGHKFLKKATIKAIKKASKSFPKADKNVELKLPVSFTLI